MPETLNPWDRQPNEPQRDYEAFCEYLMMDPRPSGGQFAERTGFKYGRRRVIERRMAKYNWRERRAARDEVEARRLLEVRTEAKIEVHREVTLVDYRLRLIQQSRKMLELSESMSQRALNYFGELKPEDMTPSAASSMARAAKDLASTAVSFEAAALGVEDIVDSLARISQGLETSDTHGSE